MSGPIAVPNLKKSQGVDLSPKSLAEKAQYDKIVKTTEEVLEIFVKNGCTTSDVYAILNGVQNTIHTFNDSRKMSEVKEFFKTIK